MGAAVAASAASTGSESATVGVPMHHRRGTYRWPDSVRVRVIKVLARHAEDVGSSLSSRKEEIERDVADLVASLPDPPPQPLTFAQITNMLTTAKRWDAQNKGSAEVRAAITLFRGAMEKPRPGLQPAAMSVESASSRASC